jgi:hypothetical protein
MVKARNQAISRRVKLRMTVEDKLAANTRKLEPILKQNSILQRHLENLSKQPLPESLALDTYVRQLTLTPSAYGFKSVQEILDIVAPAE